MQKAPLERKNGNAVHTLSLRVCSAQNSGTLASFTHGASWRLYMQVTVDRLSGTSGRCQSAGQLASCSKTGLSGSRRPLSEAPSSPSPTPPRLCLHDFRSSPRERAVGSRPTLLALRSLTKRTDPPKKERNYEEISDRTLGSDRAALAARYAGADEG